MKNKRIISYILLVCGTIVFLQCLHTLILVKGLSTSGLYPKETIQTYIDQAIFKLLYSLVTPIIFAIYSYFSIPKMGTPKLFRIVWGLLIFGSGVTHGLRLAGNLFQGLVLFLYVVLFFVVIYSHRIEERR